MNDIRPCGNNEKWCESCVSKGKCNYTKKQDIIAELEKIKDEIRGRCRFSINKIDVLDIIDNHISELKGE